MTALPYTHSCGEDAIHRLKPEVLAAFEECAAKYLRLTGQRPEVTSACRSLRHCARLMSGFNLEQLEAMYCRNGYPGYIREMAKAMEIKGGPIDEDETYAILCARTEGYVSAHLYGGALDIATDGLSNKELLETILRENGFKVLDETDLGVKCIHASYRELTPEIIKE